jgi:hypothetical protein
VSGCDSFLIRCYRRPAAISDGSHLVERLKTLLAEKEHLPTQQFVRFVNEHLPKPFWKTNDDLYAEYRQVFPKVNDRDFAKRLKDLCGARSRYLHAGEPFPHYVEFGMREVPGRHSLPACKACPTRSHKYRRSSGLRGLRIW